ncbi:MAG: hypothetical protein O6934_01015 [SAR324 cluster bacterium]|nr:hypothetical protein [SAR324 cluster bacterium]
MKVLDISTVAILLLLGGCSGFASFEYDIPLQKVLKGEGGSAEIVTTIIGGAKEQDETKYIFEDNAMRMEWHTSVDFHHFKLTNKTDQDITILWGEAAYLFPGRPSERIGHFSGGAIIRTTDSGKPSVVAARATIKDAVFPARKSLLRLYNQPLFKLDKANRKSSQAVINELRGKTVSVRLPMEVRGRKIGYRFVFLIRDIIIKD